jgi:NAD(P)-dependent dehydrogenase (short-subunit alcohol dehydrogenase family)
MTVGVVETGPQGGRAAGLRVVVTGAASGIGEALARALAAEGARVVVNDLDADRLQRVASFLPSTDGALAVPGDAASEAGAVALVSAARDHFGEIDLFCANAGVATRGGVEAPEADWDLSWQVNVMAHVRAARALLPAWLARGRGHFLATVSAAGLLTMPGTAPYSVTKHAALAFAEWMSVTYGDKGIRVQALCPQGVRTPMLEATGREGAVVLAPTAIEAADVAEAVLASLDGGRFLILPHPEVAGYYAGRAADPDAWQASMRHLQAKIDAATAPET